MVSPPVPQTGYGGFDSPQAHDDRRRRRSSGPVDVGYRNYNGPKVATLGRPSQRSAGRTSPKVAGACQRPTSLTSSVRTPPTSNPRHRSRWRLARNPVLRPSGGRVHLPLSRGWDTTLRTSLAKVRVLPVVPRAQPATARDVSCTAPAGAGLGLQNPRRRVRFPGGVRPRRIDASSGLRVTLGRRASIPWRCATATHRRQLGPPRHPRTQSLDSLAVCDRDASTPARASASPSDAEPRFPGGVRPRRIDASSGLRVTLGRRVRADDLHAATSGEDERLISASRRARLPPLRLLGVPICTSSPGDGPHMDGYRSHWFDSNHPDRAGSAGLTQASSNGRTLSVSRSSPGDGPLGDGS